MIKRHDLIVGPFQCNCTVLVCDQTREAIIIDAGADFAKIKRICDQQQIQIKYSLHTHAHFDHIGAVHELKKHSPQTKIALHQADEIMYQNLPMQGQYFGFEFNTPPPVDYFFNDSEDLVFGKHTLKVLHTPGHSPGSSCFYFKDGSLSAEPVLFSGDTLFQLSIGRTDLWGGDHPTIIKSIKQKLFTLANETLVCPGHGETTSIAIEKKSNPFLN